MKKLIIALAIALGVGAIVPAMGVTSSSVLAVGGGLEGGVCATDTSNCVVKDGVWVAKDGDAEKAETKVNNLVADIINIFSWVVGVISVIMIIFGGFKYITSGGDSSKVSSAKNTIIYALIGLVIVALAQVIVIFVLDVVTT